MMVSARCFALTASLATIVLSGGAAFAKAVVDSSLTISNLIIAPADGSVSIQGPLGTSAATNAFNSLGESASNGNTGTGSDVSASAAVTFAQGTAAALASSGSVSASSSIDITGGGALAGVTLPGSVADLTGVFDIDGTAADSVEVTFSMQLTGSLHGVSDAAGFLQAGDIAAELDIDGTPVLFASNTLPALPSLAGVGNYPDTTIPIAETLTATVPLDPTVSHFFDMHADDEQQGYTIPEPGGLFLLLIASGAVAWRRRMAARHHEKMSRPG
jgi:hypothetical protein